MDSLHQSKARHTQWLDAVVFYVARTYAVEADPLGRNVSRVYYLPWDPDAKK